MLPLNSTESFEALLDAPLVVVYKHSTRCPISLLAADEVQQFEEEHPTVPVYAVDVHDDRALARHIAAALAVTHQSPQAIVLAGGRVAWHGSHFDVRAEVLGARVGPMLRAA